MSYSTSNPVTFTMPDQDVSITAQFSPVPTTYTVTSTAYRMLFSLYC